MTQGDTNPPEKSGRTRARLLAFLVALLALGFYVLVQTGMIPFGTPAPRKAVVPAQPDAAQVATQQPAPVSAEQAAVTPPAEPVARETPASVEQAAAPQEPEQAAEPVEAAIDAAPAETPGAAEAPVAETSEAAEPDAIPAAATPAPEVEPASAEAESAEAQAAQADAPDAAVAEAPAPASAESAVATPPEAQVAAATPPDSAEGPADAPGIAIGSPGDARPSSEPAPQSQPPAAAEAAPALPRFDIIRIDAAGAGLVAGRAAPGSTVAIMIGDIQIATAEADEKGEFVAFIQTPDSDEGQVLSLIARSGVDAARGVEEVLLLPSAAPEDAAPEAPAIVKASDEGVRVVQPTALGKVDGVTLDAISYDASGDVRLSGRAPGAQPIRIYVDGAPAGAAESSAAGTWDATLTAIEEGRYVLRVDALRADGSVASRAESPFQRVFPTAEQQAQATQITVQPGNTLWVMARERYGQGILYTQIFAANREAIRDPDLIYPGQIFTLPKEQEFTP